MLPLPTVNRPGSQPWLLPRLYLVAFNGLSGALWAAVFVAVIHELAAVFLTGLSSAAFYPTHRGTVMVAQGLAFMEVLHSAAGVVSSPTTTVLIQVGSRFLVLYGVVEQVPELQEHVVFLLFLFAWSLAEVPHYLYYTLTMMDRATYFLLFMRYSLFLVLYPMGISAELFCIYSGIHFFKLTKQWSIYMPNRVNFELIFYQILQAVIVLYMVGSPYMYCHMWRQRQKYLGSKSNGSAYAVKDP